MQISMCAQVLAKLSSGILVLNFMKQASKVAFEHAYLDTPVQENVAHTLLPDHIAQTAPQLWPCTK